MDFLFFFLFLQSDGKETKAWRRSQAAKWEGKPGVCKLAANAVKCCFCARLFPREGNLSSDPAPPPPPLMTEEPAEVI